MHVTINELITTISLKLRPDGAIQICLLLLLLYTTPSLSPPPALKSFGLRNSINY